jgi:hypothetical protein
MRWIGEDAAAEVMDAGIIAAAQRFEHYEMAGYGTVQTFAKLLGEKEATELFTLTLNEEKAADKKHGSETESAGMNRLWSISTPKRNIRRAVAKTGGPTWPRYNPTRSLELCCSSSRLGRLSNKVRKF